MTITEKMMISPYKSFLFFSSACKVVVCVRVSLVNHAGMNLLLRGRFFLKGLLKNCLACYITLCLLYFADDYYYVQVLGFLCLFDEKLCLLFLYSISVY